MRIIVVEDEPNIREGIVRIIETQTKHTIVGSVNCAERGLEMTLEERPDLILTDIRMGEMSGLVMLQKIQESGVRCAAIVLTGFSNFEYARQAIQLNVIDYLLKPIAVEDLLKCLEKAEEETTDSSYMPTLEQLLMLQLTGEEVKEDLLHQVVRKRYDANVEAEHFMVLFHLKSVDTESFLWTANKIREKTDMLCLEQVIVLEVYSRHEIMLIVMQSDRNHQLEGMIETYVLPEIMESIRCLASSTRFNGLIKFKDESEQCHTMLQYSLLLQEQELITKAKVEALPRKKLCYPEQLDVQIKQAVSARDFKRVWEISKEFGDLVLDRQYDSADIKEVLCRFLCNLCVTAEEKNPDIKGFFSYNTLLSEIEAIISMDELKTYFYDVIEQIEQNRWESASQVGNTVVSHVIKDIQKRYMEDLPLTELAKGMNLTPEYVSNLFSKEMGVSFSSFLKNFRISHARRLLDENKYKIQEVAMMVGFRDPKYFNRVFKEVCGISPSEYRSKLRE